MRCLAVCERPNGKRLIFRNNRELLQDSTASVGHVESDHQATSSVGVSMPLLASETGLQAVVSGVPSCASLSWAGMHFPVRW
jgi:hypothetical protein